MTGRGDITEYAIQQMKNAGLEKAQCILRDSSKDEFNVESGEVSLLRTTRNTTLTLTGIVSDRKGSISINKTDRKSIDNAVAGVVDLAKSTEPDPANDISGTQPSDIFKRGPEKADLDLMYNRITSFLEYCLNTYPTLILEQVILDFSRKISYFRNSNGVYFESSRGYYGFYPMFTAKEGSDISSFNYTGFDSFDLEKELYRYGSVDILMKQTVEQVHTREFPGKITGEVLITPDCFDEIISAITVYLTDFPLITGTSIFKDSLEEQVAASRFTLHSNPVSDEIVAGYSFTSDGFKAENCTIIDRGTLKTYLLSLYGANKTGRKIGINRGDAYVVEPGDTSLDRIIGSMDRGILMCRFSGGNPSENGDFSGVAKNSYYIEDGEIKHPLRETMIAGNLAELLLNITDISKETINFGGTILPWILVDGITISGK